MTKNITEILSIARAHTKTAINILAGIARQETAPPSARVAAAVALLDRGWGRPAQAYTGPDGDGPVQIVVDTGIRRK